MPRTLKEVYKSWFTRAVVVVLDNVEKNWLSKDKTGYSGGLGEKTGRLKRSLRWTTTENGFTITTDEPHGAYWELGTKGRVILARPGKVLAIHLKPGKLVLAKKAVVPPQKARPWLYPGTMQAMPQVMAIGEKLTVDWLKEKFPDKTVRM